MFNVTRKKSERKYLLELGVTELGIALINW